MTSIQWTDATWNPVRGCSRVSEGCRNCYAERIAARFSVGYKEVGDEGPGPGPFNGFAEMTDTGPHWTGRVELIPEKLDEPLHWKKPRRVFVNSMSDLFHEKLRHEDIARVFFVMAMAGGHTFQVLTKRPKQMLKFFEDEPEGLYSYVRERNGDLHALATGYRWPLPNVWLGVSVEDQATADERIPLLLQTPAAVRFVSYEPALGPVSFRWMNAWPENAPETALKPYKDGPTNELDGLRRLDWLIIGGESGPGARPFDLAWARSAVAQCKTAGVPVFVKQLGARPHVGNAGAGPAFDFFSGRDRHWRMDDSTTTPMTVCALRDRKGGDPSEWPEDLRVREFPKDPAP